MDHKISGDIFQEVEVYEDFPDMEPTNLDELEDRVLEAMHKLNLCLIDSKISN